jgi:hypothetical protein
MYGGVPATININGGRAPYVLVSSEPALLPLPQQTSSNAITVLPANPGVIDPGLPPDSVPLRTVNITVRDANGVTATTSTKVGQNFLFGYSMSFGSTTCPTTAANATTAPSPCSGGDTVVSFAAVFNGNLYGAREYRLDVVSGPFTLINPQTGASGTSVGVTSDHSGTVQAIIRGAPNQVTQIATLRLTDVATQVSTYENFILHGGSSTATLQAIPNTFTFTGPDSATCGTGSGQFFIFDGTPPYTAIASDPSIVLNFIDPNHNPGRFSFQATNSQLCISNGAIIVTDSAGARTTVTVTTAPGSAPPVVPPTPLQVTPSTITLSCGQTGSVLATGGGTGSSGGGGGGGGGGSSVTYSAASTSPNISVLVAGNTISLTRTGPVGPGTGSTNYTVNVTDGTQVVPITVTAPTTCP